MTSGTIPGPRIFALCMRCGRPNRASCPHWHRGFQVHAHLPPWAVSEGDQFTLDESRQVLLGTPEDYPPGASLELTDWVHDILAAGYRWTPHRWTELGDAGWNRIDYVLDENGAATMVFSRRSDFQGALTRIRIPAKQVVLLFQKAFPGALSKTSWGTMDGASLLALGAGIMSMSPAAYEPWTSLRILDEDTAQTAPWVYEGTVTAGELAFGLGSEERIRQDVHIVQSQVRGGFSTSGVEFDPDAIYGLVRPHVPSVIDLDRYLPPFLVSPDTEIPVFRYVGTTKFDVGGHTNLLPEPEQHLWVQMVKNWAKAFGEEAQTRLLHAMTFWFFQSGTDEGVPQKRRGSVEDEVSQTPKPFVEPAVPKTESAPGPGVFTRLPDHEAEPPNEKIRDGSFFAIFDDLGASQKVKGHLVYNETKKNLSQLAHSVPDQPVVSSTAMRQIFHNRLLAWIKTKVVAVVGPYADLHYHYRSPAGKKLSRLIVELDGGDLIGFAWEPTRAEGNKWLTQAQESFRQDSLRLRLTRSPWNRIVSWERNNEQALLSKAKSLQSTLVQAHSEAYQGFFVARYSRSFVSAWMETEKTPEIDLVAYHGPADGFENFAINFSALHLRVAQKQMTFVSPSHRLVVGHHGVINKSPRGEAFFLLDEVQQVLVHRGKRLTVSKMQALRGEHETLAQLKLDKDDFGVFAVQENTTIAWRSIGDHVSFTELVTKRISVSSIVSLVQSLGPSFTSNQGDLKVVAGNGATWWFDGTGQLQFVHEKKRMEPSNMRRKRAALGENFAQVKVPDGYAVIPLGQPELWSLMREDPKIKQNYRIVNLAHAGTASEIVNDLQALEPEFPPGQPEIEVIRVPLEKIIYYKGNGLLQYRTRTPGLTQLGDEAKKARGNLVQLKTPHGNIVVNPRSSEVARIKKIHGQEYQLLHVAYAGTGAVGSDLLNDFVARVERIFERERSSFVVYHALSGKIIRFVEGGYLPYQTKATSRVSMKELSASSKDHLIQFRTELGFLVVGVRNIFLLSRLLKAHPDDLELMHAQFEGVPDAQSLAQLGERVATYAPKKQTEFEILRDGPRKSIYYVGKGLLSYETRGVTKKRVRAESQSDGEHKLWFKTPRGDMILSEEAFHSSGEALKKIHGKKVSLEYAAYAGKDEHRLLRTFAAQIDRLVPQKQTTLTIGWNGLTGRVLYHRRQEILLRYRNSLPDLQTEAEEAGTHLVAIETRDGFVITGVVQQIFDFVKKVHRTYRIEQAAFGSLPRDTSDLDAFAARVAAYLMTSQKEYPLTHPGPGHSIYYVKARGLLTYRPHRLDREEARIEAEERGVNLMVVKTPRGTIVVSRRAPVTDRIQKVYGNEWEVLGAYYRGEGRSGQPTDKKQLLRFGRSLVDHTPKTQTMVTIWYPGGRAVFDKDKDAIVRDREIGGNNGRQ